MVPNQTKSTSKELSTRRALLSARLVRKVQDAPRIGCTVVLALSDAASPTLPRTFDARHDDTSDESVGTETPPRFPKKSGPDSRRRPLWLDVAIPPSRDIRLLRPPSLPKGERFETFADAANIDRKNIARLMAQRSDLAAEIEKYEIELTPGTSAISARASGRFRIYDIAERLRIEEEYEGPHEIATIYLDAFSAGQLHAAEIVRAHGALRSKLKRAGFPGSILTGGTEAAWIEKHGLWILHCHLLAIGVPEEAWDRLRKSLPNAGPAVALKVQALKDPAKQLSYCQKFNSSHKPGKRLPNGKATMYRLPTARLIEWGDWVVNYRFEDFGFHFGARRRGGHIVPDA